MSQIPTKEFNKIVKKSGCDKERTVWLKQRRRTLKNRYSNFDEILIYTNIFFLFAFLKILHISRHKCRYKVSIFRGYASSCRENRENEQNGKQVEIAEKTNTLMEKRTRLAEQRKKQIDLIDLYKKTFRRIERYHNLHCSKEKYSQMTDIDIEEDLFDSSDSTDDDENNGEDDTTVTTIVL